MIYRVSDALEEIAEYVSGAGVDLCNSESRDRAIKELNRATRHLMREGDWDGMEQELVLPLDGQQLVLDDRIETIRLAKWRGGAPMQIYSQAFKYLEGGFGETEGARPVSSIVDLGDGVPTHTMLPRAMRIMAYSDKKEDADTVLEIRGTDANGKDYIYKLPVRHHLLDDKPPAYTGPSDDYWTTGQFTNISELRKKTTRGMVHVYGYSPDDGQLCWLTTLRPETTSPCHRRYHIPGAVEGTQIVAQVSMRYYPVHFDDEPLLIQNLDALAIMVQALDKRDKGDMANYQALKNSALSQLKKQLRKKHRGEQSGLQVRVSQTLTGGRNYAHKGGGQAMSRSTTGSGAPLQVQEAACSQTVDDTYARKNHTHDDRYYTETEVDAKLATRDAEITGLEEAIADIEVGATDWDDIGDKPDTFPPETHTHDDRYYTETEIDDSLENKSDVGHTHDDRYYTESELDTALDGKSDTGHNHDSRYYTESEVDAALSGKSDTGHTHDDRYYTESEVDASLADKLEDAPSDGNQYARQDGAWEEVSGGGGGASELSDLSDVSSSTATNRNSLVANGSAWVSRALVVDDISDLPLVGITGSYIDLSDLPTLGTASELNVGTSANNVVQLNGSGELPAVSGANLTDLPGGGDALTTNPLSQFAATTSAQLRGVLSDETGTGAAVFADTPTLVTPVLGTPTSGALTNCTSIPAGQLTGTIPDARVSESNITQHEGALTITESQISDLGSYLVSGDIDTLAELNAIVGDATLIDTADARLSDDRDPTAHASEHTDGTDDIQSATNSQKGLATGAHITAIEANTAKLTANTANVTAAGALMDSEVTNLPAVKAFDPDDYISATAPFWVEVVLTASGADIATGTAVAYLTHTVAGTITGFKLVCNPDDEPSAAAVEVDMNSINLSTGAATSRLSAVASIATSANVSTGGTISGTQTVAFGDQTSFDIDQGSDGKELRGLVQITPSSS